MKEQEPANAFAFIQKQPEMEVTSEDPPNAFSFIKDKQPDEGDQKQISEDQVFAYTAMRLTQIGKELEALDNGAK